MTGMSNNLERLHNRMRIVVDKHRFLLDQLFVSLERVGHSYEVLATRREHMDSLRQSLAEMRK